MRSRICEARLDHVVLGPCRATVRFERLSSGQEMIGQWDSVAGTPMNSERSICLPNPKRYSPPCTPSQAMVKRCETHWPASVWQVPSAFRLDSPSSAGFSKSSVLLVLRAFPGSYVPWIDPSSPLVAQLINLCSITQLHRWCSITLCLH